MDQGSGPRPPEAEDLRRDFESILSIKVLNKARDGEEAKRTRVVRECFEATRNTAMGP